MRLSLRARSTEEARQPQPRRRSAETMRLLQCGDNAPSVQRVHLVGHHAGVIGCAPLQERTYESPTKRVSQGRQPQRQRSSVGGVGGIGGGVLLVARIEVTLTLPSWSECRDLRGENSSAASWS